ncbi:hypothetical protein BDV28DRAFT_144380 [Aspergillus coremiiformis]|uniref:DUF3752 domain-containing protein n=1 Tax=Aspergillus coremiiformis TaxID=138285 RepID=A0A5N6YRE7_9EURO|nr:hypothetical protein BDV28DRAFT_144380 [Aspergillus coremiiformis]
MEQIKKRKFEQSVSYTESDVDQLDRIGKRRDMVGPIFSLNLVNEHTPVPEDDDKSSDYDDIGPSLPSLGAVVSKIPDNKIHSDSLKEPLTEQAYIDEDRRNRDEWMLQPPGSAGWTSRVDPTKLRSRKFQTGRSTSNPPLGEADSPWTETPEQKMKRLQDKIMGVSSIGPSIDQKARPSRVTQAMQANIQKYHDAKLTDHTVENVSRHLKECKKDDDDDPSNRPFDKEKDMALSSKITRTQRQKMINKAADFGSRFRKGNYL